MIFFPIVLAAYVALGSLFWLLRAVCMLRTVRAVPLLTDIEVDDCDAPARLSVVVAARNEAATIESAIGSLSAQDYDDLQIILIDDRSTDSTGRIIDRLAQRDPRIRAVHITERPDGWLGKVHALHQGSRHADGEYVLFTDADVHFEPGALRRAMAYCVRNHVDHLAGIPNLRATPFVLTTIILTFMKLLTMKMRFWKVSDPQSPAYMGVGAFNLVRREAFEATAGFEWLRMEVADDVGLGLMMKRSGARCRLLQMRNLIGLHWYQSIPEMARGTEKGFATVVGCSLWRCLWACAVLVGLELAPLVGLAVGGIALAGARGLWAWAAAAMAVAGATAVAAMVISAMPVSRWARQPFLPEVLTPLGTLVLAALFLRAGVLGRKRGGVVWRETFYPKRQLLDGMRVKL